MSGRSGACRVIVRSDQVLVADTVQVALRARGLDVVERDPGARPCADVGLVITELTSLCRVRHVQRLIRNGDLPWVVVATTPCGPGWAAVYAAGAGLVVDSSVSLDRVTEELVALQGGRPPEVTIDPTVVDQWQALAARLRGVPRRDLGRWCRGDRRETMPPIGAGLVDGFSELRQIETLLHPTATGPARPLPTGLERPLDPGPHHEPPD